MLLSFDQFINESINNKPIIFSHTIYRIPTTEELKELHSHVNQLTSKEIYNGFGYTMIGRGIESKKNLNLIITSIEKLIEMYPDEIKYKEALEFTEHSFFHPNKYFLK